MRNYIFTKRESRIVTDFLAEKIPITNRGLSQLRTRLKASPSLAKDIELLAKLRKALAESETAVSA